MDLDSDSVDAAICRWGYMLMADPAAALAETRRVLRDGGPLALAVWAPPAENPWAAVPGSTLVELGHLPAPDPDEPSMFALADSDRVRALLAGAGFAEIALEEIPFRFRYPSADHLWETQAKMSTRLAAALNRLPQPESDATRAEIERNLAEYRQADGSYEMPALCFGAVAR
jgi:SAM-dependent methyltransferase